ncbi:YafY family protein [Galactobacter sp.]|uniref:helix-turn-helix transcriptional regulator n=1 Tax=Galactobacter sp. TaxID=2676125 RepID=UPI0025C4A46D|nr:YafY family protein [Galactobacter sp.]
METTSSISRVLSVLSLLQQRPTWTATELAERLDVTTRCIRRDVARLRELGYPIEASVGTNGGYRLGSGTRMPPLLLEHDEAVATAIALRLLHTGSVTGGAGAARGALAKLEQVMPPRLRATVQAVHESTAALTGPTTTIGPDLLAGLATACHDLLRVRFDYTDGQGNQLQRRVKPVQLVTAGLRWYLMAWDLDRENWRTFRLDRMYGLEVSTWRFTPREHPDPAYYVQHAIAVAPYERQVLVRVKAEPEDLSAVVPPQVGTIEPDAEKGWSRLHVGGMQLEWIAFHLALMDYQVDIVEPDELREVATDLAQRLERLGSR